MLPNTLIDPSQWHSLFEDGRSSQDIASYVIFLWLCMNSYFHTTATEERLWHNGIPPLRSNFGNHRIAPYLSRSPVSVPLHRSIASNPLRKAFYGNLPTHLHPTTRVITTGCWRRGGRGRAESQRSSRRTCRKPSLTTQATRAHALRV